MPLTYDAFRECSVLGLVCLDKWVRLSALHVIELWLELHTHIPGPDTTATDRGGQGEKWKEELTVAPTEATGRPEWLPPVMAATAVGTRGDRGWRRGTEARGAAGA